ncbi:hypothetical protein BHM03_00031349 [Ensete ventricosum]|nr:hypothetical protein BHM03_00031349 [Ensete ventricosum]
MSSPPPLKKADVLTLYPTTSIVRLATPQNSNAGTHEETIDTLREVGIGNHLGVFNAWGETGYTTPGALIVQGFADGSTSEKDINLTSTAHACRTGRSGAVAHRSTVGVSLL